MEEINVLPVIGRGRAKIRGRGIPAVLKQEEFKISGFSASSQTGASLVPIANAGNNGLEQYADLKDDTVKNENETLTSCDSQSGSNLDIAEESMSGEAGAVTFADSLEEVSSTFGDSVSITSSEPCSFQLASSSIMVGEPETKSQRMSRVEAAHEFRMDAILSAAPIPKYYRCCVCGCPAGYNTYACKVNGHPTCYLCVTELDIKECPYLRKDGDGEVKICESLLYQYPSMFRGFVVDNTEVSCVNHWKGCQTVGVWECIQEHQEECEFAEK